MKKKRPQKASISQEVLDLSEERSKIKQAKQNNPSLKPRYNFLNREIKRKTRSCQRSVAQRLLQTFRVENAHQAAKSKEVYATIKKITKSASK